MGCKEIRNNLSDISNEQEMTEEMRAHLSSCPDCNRAWEYILEAENLIKLEKEEKISPFFMTRLEAAIESNHEQEVRFYNIIKPKLAAFMIVAGMLIGIVLPFVFQTSYESKMEPTQEEFLFFEMAVEPNEMDLLNELS
ncbi:MAG: zf-HC2 domain-containing protein [Marinilabiliaceae bacterium]|nr:zf-HC2 domain-containing protein [Marinilabiliaceae bacterium]